MKVKFSLMHQLVGAFILIAAAIMILASFYLIKQKKLFVEMKHFYTFLNRGNGVSASTKIFLKGIEIGYVTKVFMTPKGKIKVLFEIFPEYSIFFRGFTYVKVVSGSLIGGKQLEIIPKGTGELVKNGALIFSEDDEVVQKLLEKGQIKTKGQDMNKKIMGILDDVKIIVKNVNQLSTEMIKPDSNVQKILVNIRNITSNISQLTEVLAKTSPEIKKIVVDSQSAISETNKLIKSARKSAAVKMFTPSEELPRAKDKVVQIDTRDL